MVHLVAASFTPSHAPAHVRSLPRFTSWKEAGVPTFELVGEPAVNAVALVNSTTLAAAVPCRTVISDLSLLTLITLPLSRPDLSAAVIWKAIAKESITPTRDGTDR